ncbi:hypothetical protein [Blastococcus haudaquaticus]|uniref:Dolichyl-phosphate-mannose-protein mannosyltransferase n=1 Tax=Blastococcus haudaquaticus TaxID=1938745 RepID=A0A286GFC7_9ACTN|nr:hypothetical protein [Blastococcus haudaquaticus]SOD93829.1 hypothetical protein SAMN06272739_0448 [Blastococcus haudaquaticus]
MTLAPVLGCLALVTWSSWRWAAVARLPRPVDVLVACGVLVYGILVGTVLFVGGVLHALSAGPVAAAAVATAVLAGATTAGRASRGRVRDARRSVGAALRRLGPALRSPLVSILALGATAAAGYRVAIAVMFPPLDWDGLAYHLPMADFWLQEERLLPNPFSFWAQVHPGAAESVVTWLGALSGSVRAAAAVQVGAAALGALAVVALCRGAGCRPRSALVAGLLFVTAPLVLTQLSTAEVDVAAAAILLATWHLLLVALRRVESLHAGAAGSGVAQASERALAGNGARPAGSVALAERPAETVVTPRHRALAPGRSSVLPTLVVAGVGAGVAVGVKSTNLIAFGMLGLVLVGTVLGRAVAAGRPGRGLGQAALQAACFGLPAALLGAWWYVRNATLWGNPFYPVGIAGLPGNPDVMALLGVDPRQVGTTNPWWATLVSWADDLAWRPYYYGSPTGGLGAYWVLVLAPAIPVAIALLARSGRSLYAWGLLAPGVLLLLAYPGHHHPRYTLYLLGIGGVALAVVLDRLPRLPRSAVLAVVVAAALFSASAASWQALDISGSDRGPTPRQVAALMLQPARERDAVGLRGAFTDVDRAAAGSTFVVPPEFGDYGQPWILPHSMWGDDLGRRVVESDQPIADADQALRALDEFGAEYLVVAKGSPLEAGLTADGRLLPAFEVGWLARAWTASSGTGG